MDVQGFVKLFAHDGVIHAGVKTFRGEELPYVLYLLGKLAPDVAARRRMPRRRRSELRESCARANCKFASAADASCDSDRRGGWGFWPRE